jgi:formylmethanofuran dehydrogenase subunit E
MFMRELVGQCQECGKNVYCENGFFDGVQENGKLLCNDCADESESI